MRDDAVGFFWTEESKPRGSKRHERALPPIPDSEWVLPEEFPSLDNYDAIAVDVETYDPDLKTLGPGAHRDGYIAGIAVGAGSDFRAYYPIAHKDGPNLPKHIVLGWLSEQLSRERQPKVGANLLYDVDFLLAADVDVRGPLYDVQVAEPLLNENRLTYQLGALAKSYLGETKVEETMHDWLERAFGATNIKGNIWRAPPSVVGPYAESDVDLPLRIFKIQEERLKAEGLWDLFLMESELLPMLLAMRRRGVRVNLAQAEQLREDLLARNKRLLRRLKDEVGFEPEVWAADSLARVFDKLGLEYPRTEKTEAPSFRKEWLEKHPHPVAKAVMDVRRFDKLRGTFVEGYILDGHVNGRIHSSFHPLRSDEGGAVTGRFSSSNPNLQNIPMRDPEFGPLMRSMFIPEEGQLWWKFDWSQIEYRLIVHFAALMRFEGADVAVEAYRSSGKTDYHQLVAEMTGLSRRDAKNLNFGLAYGQGVPLLCANLGVSMEEGRKIIDTYHARAPYVRQLSRTMERAATKRGYIRTILGRRRRFDAWEYKGNIIGHHEPGARRAFTHKAMNSGIQGSAADIMKTAMVQIHRSGALDVLGAPHLTVHDELDGSMPDTPQGREALAEVRHIMETCIALEVPLLADGGTGPHWGAIE